MVTPFLGQISTFAFQFAPKSFAFCKGQLVQISSNHGLFSLLGTSFGGDGRSTFAYPDMRGRTPVGVGGPYALGKSGGEDTVDLEPDELPSHKHDMVAIADTAVKFGPNDDRFLAKTGVHLYTAPYNLVGLSASAVSSAGGSRAHMNIQPSLAINFVICIAGAYPQRN